MIRGFIGVIHLPAMPGDPAYRGGGFWEVLDTALRDAEALVRGGVDGIIVENFGSAPFRKGDASSRVSPHQLAAITLVAQACKTRFDVKVGVNCLRNDAMSAMGAAAATDSDFIRVNVHTGAYVTDQGLIEGEAHETLRYRKSLDAAGIAILADVLVKHATPLAPVSPADATADTLKRGMADGVIVTGAATGAPVDRDTLSAVRDAADGKPVFIGSGLTYDSAADFADLIDGAIVGTWLKHGGELAAPVDTKRVEQLAKRLRSLWG